MTGKAERTSQYIIETVSPIFNRHGYFGTSMKDITTATGLTKGAIYGNFENKEELALEAFKFQSSLVLGALAQKTAMEQTMIGKLHAISRFYRNYETHIHKVGGCPVLNVGIDANNGVGPLSTAVRNTVQRMLSDLERIISKGIGLKEIKSTVNAKAYAGRIYALIEGGVFLMMMMKDSVYLNDTLDQFEKMIDEELKI